MNALPFLTQQFWAATWNSGFSSFLTHAMKTKGGLTTTSKIFTIVVALTQYELMLHHITLLSINSGLNCLPTTSVDGIWPTLSVDTIFLTSSVVPFCNKDRSSHKLINKKGPCSYELKTKRKYWMLLNMDQLYISYFKTSYILIKNGKSAS